jgi:glycosyltransferase involved in cell wall biosynthesis
LSDAEKRTIEPRLHYHGNTLSFGDMALMYQMADAYVSPYFSEGFNMPVLEAAACGCR